MKIEELVIFGLTVWRISSLFVNERGPFNVFVKIRELSGLMHDERGEVYMIPDTLLAGILSCVWCCSIWIGIGWAVFWIFFPILALKIAVPFAFSAVAILLETMIRKST